MQKLILFPLFFIAFVATAQVHDFGIWIGKKEIGSIQAHHEIRNNRNVYRVISEASFRVVWKYHRTTDMQVVFFNDTLESSVSKVVMNDDVKEDSRYWKDQEGYKCHKQDQVELRVAPILYSSSMLYFQEPVGVDSVYSETFLENSFIEKINETQYKMYLPGNRENIYTYDKGTLVEIRADRTVDLVFKRKTTVD